MMVRVFALYDRKPMLGSFLALWFFLSRGLNVWNGLESLRGMETDHFCIMKGTPDSSKWFSLTILTNQLLLWVLILKKYRSTQKDGWSMPPVLRVVMRDSSWVLILITGFLIATLPYAVFVQELGHIIFCLMICLFSITACRLILNMRSMKNMTELRTYDPELTSVINTTGETRSESPPVIPAQ